jgi:hypothetical protein
VQPANRPQPTPFHHQIPTHQSIIIKSSANSKITNHKPSFPNHHHRKFFNHGHTHLSTPKPVLCPTITITTASPAQKLQSNSQPSSLDFTSSQFTHLQFQLPKSASSRFAQALPLQSCAITNSAVPSKLLLITAVPSCLAQLVFSSSAAAP